MNDSPRKMTPFAAAIFQGLIDANKTEAERYRRDGPPPIIAYAIELPAEWPQPSILVCTQPECQPGNPENIRERIPMTRADIDSLTMRSAQGARCDSCGTWLTTQAPSPDPRD